MKTIWFIILLSLAGQAHADICEPKMSEEQEKFVYVELAEMSFEQQLSFANFLTITRKKAFEEGALHTLSSIDEEIYFRVNSILQCTNMNEHIDKNAVLEAVGIFLKKFSYYPLTWSAEWTDSLNNKIEELENKNL